MSLPGHLLNKLQFLVDGKKVNSVKHWHGGSMIYFDIPQANNASYIQFHVKGFKHYCTKSTDPSLEPPAPPPPAAVSSNIKYIMHVHLRYWNYPEGFERSILDGIANHLLYHRCALNLFNYEIVIQREQIPFFLAHAKIHFAIEQGWLTLIIRQDNIPSPILINGWTHNDLSILI